MRDVTAAEVTGREPREVGLWEGDRKKRSKEGQEKRGRKEPTETEERKDTHKRNKQTHTQTLIFYNFPSDVTQTASAQNRVTSLKGKLTRINSFPVTHILSSNVPTIYVNVPLWQYTFLSAPQRNVLKVSELNKKAI